MQYFRPWTELTTPHDNGVLDPARISIAAEVCGVCHGEPTRHARFQQWQESSHGQYGLALEEATVEGHGATAGHCGRCHSGQGFLAWIKQGDLTKVIQAAHGNATVAELAALGRTTDTVQPQTCATCHDPGTNHTFVPSLTICVQCHGVFDGGTLQESAQAELNRLSDVMAKYLQAKIKNAGTVFLKDYTPHTFNGKSYDLKSGNVQVSADNVTVSVPTEPHGQIGFTVNFTTPVDFTYSPPGESPHILSLSQAQAQLGDFTTDGTAALIPTDNALVRAGWNFFLIQGDGSKGVHNPSFTFSAVDAARGALEAALEVEVPD